MMTHKLKVLFSIGILAGLGMTTPVAAQQISERTPYQFKTYNTPAALQRAIAIEQVRDGFGTRAEIANTTIANTSNSVGTLNEIQAILDGDNSMLNMSPIIDQVTSGGSQSSSSDQSANNGNGNGNGNGQ